MVDYPMVFPLALGPDQQVWYEDTFYAPRATDIHHAQDLLVLENGKAVKGTPILAVADGTVGYVNWSRNPDDLNPERCCTVTINHDDGWASWYIHLDNDTPGTDDGLGWGIAEGILPGAPVAAGEVIGWVGDSGNCDTMAGCPPHLHIELIDPAGVIVNPYEALRAAEAAPPPDPAGEPAEDPIEDPEGASSENPYEGRFSDDDDSVHRYNIDAIAELGITRGCNAANDHFCPETQITRGQIAAFLRRHLDLPSVTGTYFADIDGSMFEDDINSLAAVGIAFECAEDFYCPDIPLRRDEMAELVVRSFGYTDPGPGDWFHDDDESPFHDAIDRLRAAGITKGCDASDSGRFCPARSLTRAEMASFLARAIGVAQEAPAP
jgi:hypothetical protein